MGYSEGRKYQSDRYTQQRLSAKAQKRQTLPTLTQRIAQAEDRLQWARNFGGDVDYFAARLAALQQEAKNATL